MAQVKRDRRLSKAQLTLLIAWLEDWQRAEDAAFDWCDYDMEIEAAKQAFAKVLTWLK